MKFRAVLLVDLLMLTLLGILPNLRFVEKVYDQIFASPLYHFYLDNKAFYINLKGRLIIFTSFTARL